MTTLLFLEIDDSGAGWERFAAGLPEEEQERAGRYRFDADRLRFAKCRAVLRERLGDSLGIPPAEVRLRFGPHGKPYPDHGDDLQFNLSHTRGGALIGLARGAEIGVDIEHAKAINDLDGVARKVYTDRERSGLAELEGEQRRALFFRLWAAKEAFLKAIGSGLSLAPAEVEAYLPEPGVALGRFECGSIESASSLRCVEVPLGAGDLHAMLCAPEEGCEFELERV